MDGAVDGDGLLLGWGDELEVRPCPREVALRYGDSWALHIDCCGDPLSEDEELTEAPPARSSVAAAADALAARRFALAGVPDSPPFTPAVDPGVAGSPPLTPAVTSGVGNLAKRLAAASSPAVLVSSGRLLYYYYARRAAGHRRPRRVFGGLWRPVGGGGGGGAASS
jgi:hypothetical protein